MSIYWHSNSRAFPTFLLHAERGDYKDISFLGFFPPLYSIRLSAELKHYYSTFILCNSWLAFVKSGCNFAEFPDKRYMSLYENKYLANLQIHNSNECTES